MKKRRNLDYSLDVCFKKKVQRRRRKAQQRIAGREIRKKNLFLSKGNRIESGQGTSIPRTRSSVYDGRSGRKKKSKSIDLIFHGDWVYARDSAAHDENGTADGLPGK